MRVVQTTLFRLGMIAAAMIVLPGALAFAQEVPSRANDKEVNSLLERMKKSSETFKKSLDRALDKSSLDRTRREDAINDFVKEFEKATRVLEERFDQRKDVSGDVTEVLNRAASIDGFVRRHALNEQAKSDWDVLRTDLNTLARYFNVTWNWDKETT